MDDLCKKCKEFDYDMNRSGGASSDVMVVCDHEKKEQKAPLAEDYRLLKYIYTPDLKTKWWGDGEWVNEADEVEFSHRGIECVIRRVVIVSPGEKAFGGHLCGYVLLPNDHPWECLRADQIPVSAHGGITFKQSLENREGIWIGFDCAHCFDVIPGLEIFVKNDECKKDLKTSHHNRSVWEMTYRNLDYVEIRCRELADQVISP